MHTYTHTYTCIKKMGKSVMMYCTQFSTHSGIQTTRKPGSKGNYNMIYYVSLTKLFKLSKAQFPCVKRGESYASFAGLLRILCKMYTGGQYSGLYIVNTQSSNHCNTDSKHMLAKVTKDMATCPYLLLKVNF